MDLIQLVDFYQLNAGALPTQLHYYVTRLLWFFFGPNHRWKPWNSGMVDERWRWPLSSCGGPEVTEIFGEVGAKMCYNLLTLGHQKRDGKLILFHPTFVDGMEFAVHPCYKGSTATVSVGCIPMSYVRSLFSMTVKCLLPVLLLIEPAVRLTWAVCSLIGFNPRRIKALQRELASITNRPICLLPLILFGFFLKC